MADTTFDPVARTEKISTEIRKALIAALPAPLEQFFTVMVPGKVVNFDDYTEGFDTSGNATSPVLPNITELNQAMLCDDLPVLAAVQLGPTGKSVARSYDAAISKLVPAGTTVGVDVADPNNLTEEEARYEKAMEWLNTQDPETMPKSRIDVYVEKQEAYTKALEVKTKAFNDALNTAMNDPRNTTVADKRAAYDIWVSENARTYRDYMQAAYMDWVVSGKKEEVEYWFAVVDRDTAMARVEASKEAMRAAVVQDTDGSVEYQKVKLTPSNWAVLAKNKALSGTDQTRTAEWYTWEITRLQKMNSMLAALKDKKPVTNDPTEPIVGDSILDQKMAAFVEARSAYQRTQADPKASDADKAAAYQKFDSARTELHTAEANNTKANIDALNALSQTAQNEMYNKMAGPEGLASQLIEENNAKIQEYTTARDALTKQDNNKNDLVAGLAQDAGIPEAMADPEADSAAQAAVDYFTAITVEISSSSVKDSSSSRASSSSFGASIGWGLWSAGANASYSSASSDAATSMAKNACKISFECMRVDISRSWLRSELFYDADLTTGPGEVISPGFTRLRALMEGSLPNTTQEAIEEELQRYSTFPLYPTAFILGANVVLEITGETSDIQAHFQTSSVSGGGSFGYGPFTVSSSHAHTSQSKDSSCEATANGCRITIKSPQIIGWVSQMVPALPRLKNQPLP